MNILIFGAGRSAYFTIQYLLKNAQQNGWNITVADASDENIKLCTQGFANFTAHIADVNNTEERQKLIGSQQIVISLLPALFHILVAKDCLAFGVNLITPSYLSPEIQAMQSEVEAKGLFFINELGLDPGIDHMSAMQIIDGLHNKGAQISSFKSYCGGLISAEDDTNPWHYKFTWNPYNVIRAGSDGALCRINYSHKYIPYHNLFSQTEEFDINGEMFEGYYNRNSERYIDLYNLQETETFVRGTLRYKDFCSNWNILVNMGLTHDSIQIKSGNIKRWKEYFEIFKLPENEEISYMHIGKNALDAMNWLIENNSVNIPDNATPAQALQVLLEEKWKMQQDDKDRVVMIHEFIYTIGEKCFKLKSWLDIEGKNNIETAMAKTVGLPLALAAELVAGKKLRTPGVIMPVIKEIYEPLLRKLAEENIVFKEEEREIIA